jgi:hypothetical protein
LLPFSGSAFHSLNLKNYKARYFDKKTTLELTDVQVTNLFKNKTLSSRISLTSLKSAYDTFKVTKKGTIKYSKFNDLPEAAQIALWDMAYCLGIRGLKTFRNQRTACKQGDWKVAETACKIANTPSQRRNNDDKAKFQEAVRQEVAKNKANKP